MFKPQTDRAVRELIGKSFNTALSPNARLSIRKEQTEAPVLLADRSAF